MVKRQFSDILKSAERGDAEAQLLLCYNYQTGKGVSKDSFKASQWCRRAAEQGYPDAQYALGLIYSFGNGVPVDKAESLRWFQMAAEHGHVEAQETLGAIYYDGIDVKEDYPKSLVWYRKAAAQGSATAQFYIGLAYEYGDGVAIDYSKAADYYQKAVELGHAFSEKQLRELRTKNLLEPKNYPFPPISDFRPILGVEKTQKPNEATLRHLTTDDRLASGSLLVDNLRQSAGKGKLTLDNGLSEDAYVKLVRDGKMVAAFYVRSHDKFTYSTIPNGSFSVVYCTGYGWDAAVRSFARGRQASRYDAPLNYSTRVKSDATGTTTSTDVVTLTLHKVAFGNTKTSSVGLDEFDRY